MDFPERNNNDGNDGPGRPPRKIAQNSSAEDENNVMNAFGDASDLPLLAFLFMAAMLAEYFRGHFECGC